MSPRRSQQGSLLIAAVVLVVVIAVFVAVLGNLVSSDVKSSADTLGSVQALYLAESGLEVEQRRWAQNLTWYRSATDPNPGTAGAQALGAGSFTSYGNLPATLLRRVLTPVATDLIVYSTDRFPATGTLQIEEDLTATAEFVTYTGIGVDLATGFPKFTGVTRGQTVGTVTSAAGPHQRNDAVYPVTTLIDALSGASCNAIPAPLRIAYHPKFLTAGTLDIEGEEISYGGSSVAGGNMTLTGVKRCVGLLGPLAHAAGQPVTPVLVGGDSADYEIETVATGTVGGNIRYARRTIQR